MDNTDADVAFLLIGMLMLNVGLYVKFDWPACLLVTGCIFMGWIFIKEAIRQIKGRI